MVPAFKLLNAGFLSVGSHPHLSSTHGYNGDGLVTKIRQKRYSNYNKLSVCQCPPTSTKAAPFHKPTAFETPVDTAHELGYADRPNLTRLLKRFLG
jgi:hypothetical protein